MTQDILPIVNPNSGCEPTDYCVQLFYADNFTFLPEKRTLHGEISSNNKPSPKSALKEFKT